MPYSSDLPSGGGRQALTLAIKMRPLKGRSKCYFTKRAMFVPIYRYYAILELNFCHSYFEINSSACKKVEGACPLRTYTGSLRLRPLVARHNANMGQVYLSHSAVTLVTSCCVEMDIRLKRITRGDVRFEKSRITFYDTNYRNTCCGTWYLPRSQIHKDRAVLITVG